MSRLWDNITDNIDERFTNEAAEYFSKHSNVDFIEESGSSYDGKALSLKVDSSEKKQSKGKVIAIICAAAAAVGLCVFGGIQLMKGENPLLPADTSTTEISDTLETGETAETGEAIDIVQRTEIDAQEVTLKLTHLISRDDLIAQAGYDVPIDMDTFGDDYQAAVEYVNALDDEAKKQRYIEQNYFSSSLWNICYVGSDTADWIGAINYEICHVDGISTPFYSRVFYVKDGVITEDIFTADRESTVCRMDDYVYITNGSDGLFMLNTDTMAIQAITADSASFIETDDKYVLFRNRESNVLQVYVRESGEIISTDIYMGQYDGTMHRFMGDRIRYYDDKTEDVYDFMLPSGEIQTPEVGLSYFYTKEDNYDNEYYDIGARALVEYPDQFVKITDKATGKEEKLYLSDLPSEIYNQNANSLQYLHLFGHTLYIPLNTDNDSDGIYFVYDIPTGKARYFINNEKIDILTAYGDDVIGYKSGPEQPDNWPDEYYFKVELYSASSEEQTDEWASVEIYNGDDEVALEFKNTLSEAVQADNQAIHDEYMENAEESGFTEEEVLLMIDQMQYGVTSYYVEANGGAQFWLKRYMRKGGQFFSFTEIYLRKGDEFTLIDTVDWLDVQYIGETLVRCSGDYLYYSHDDGIVERISTSGEKERVFDVNQLAWQDLGVLETVSLMGDGTTMRGSGDVLELNFRYNHNSRYLDYSVLRDIRVEIDTDNNVLKQETSSFGYEIVDGEGIPFEIATGEHDHDPSAMLAETLLLRGQEKLSDAIKLYGIKAGAGIDSELQSEADIEALYNSTFAGEMHNYDGHYYASGTPTAAVWYDEDDRLDESLWSAIDKGADLGGDNGSDELHEYWTKIVGVLDHGTDWVDYQLCTICKNTSESINSTTIPYYYEHSVMRIRKIDGEWKITQLRTALGNEYGTKYRDELTELGYRGLTDEYDSYIDIRCNLLREDGHEIIGISMQDFDFDGVDELIILTEKNESKVLRLFEQQGYGWEFVKLFSGLPDYNNLPDAAQFIRYDDGFEHYYYTAYDGVITIISLDDTDNAYNPTDVNNGKGFGYDAYMTPIEYPSVLSACYEAYPEITPDPQEYAESLTERLMRTLSDGNKDYERTFNVLDWDIKHVEVIPIEEASAFYNVTDEERALENAWIVEPEVWYTYDGKVSGKRGSADDWCESLGAENIGFLMWQEGDTFFLRSRWLNCGTEQLMTDGELQTFLDENLQPALDITSLIYFSGDNARAAGMKMIEESLYEVAPDFPYSSVDEIKAEAAKYFTEDAVEQLNIGGWFTVVDGKLCARTFNKGLSCSGYTAENAEVLSQYNFPPYSKVKVKLKITEAVFMSGYNTECYGVVTLEYDSVKGKWLFSDKLI